VQRGWVRETDMPELLLTHGYFLSEDQKEQQIMKPYPPLGLLYLSSFLKARGVSVEVFDSTFGARADLHRRFGQSSGGVIGIYTNLLTRASVLDIVAVARQHDWTVILGGPESANHIEEYLAHGADAIVVGEGEVTLLELLPVLDRLGPRRLHSVPGLAFTDEQGAVVRTPERARVGDLDALPFPDREAIDHGLYLDAWKTHHGASSINLITARGCPYRCNWCSHAVYGHSHRRRSPGNVADELDLIIERYDPDQVWYADDVFTISHPWMESYASELAVRGLHRPFETITRADRLQTKRSAELLRQLGCYRIWIGSESGSQRILDRMERGVTVAQVREAVRLAREQGIEVGMFLMWGYDGEEIEDIAATVEHVRICDPDIFFTTVTYPIKGTGYFDRISKGIQPPDRWAESSDRDYVVSGRKDRAYYRLADHWLRSEVDASRTRADNPQRAAELESTAAAARAALQNWVHE